MERDQWVTILILVVVTAGLSLGVWLPHQLRVSQLRGQIKRAHVRLDENMDASMDMASLFSEVEQLSSRGATHEKYVPQGGELAGLLRQLGRDLASEGVTDQEVRVQPVVDGGDYHVIPVAIRFQGSFTMTYGLIDRIESMRRLVRITRLDIRGESRDPRGRLAVEIELAAYYEPGGSQEP